jgi:hypothetical protein
MFHLYHRNQSQLAESSDVITSTFCQEPSNKLIPHYKQNFNTQQYSVPFNPCVPPSHQWSSLHCPSEGGLMTIFWLLLQVIQVLEHPHPNTARVWHTPKLDDKWCGLFQIASGATTFQWQARGPVKLILVRFILHSTCDWSISYLRGTFGV